MMDCKCRDIDVFKRYGLEISPFTISRCQPIVNLLLQINLILYVKMLRKIFMNLASRIITKRTLQNVLRSAHISCHVDCLASPKNSEKGMNG
jgi:hypothetical protein